LVGTVKIVTPVSTVGGELIITTTSSDSSKVPVTFQIGIDLVAGTELLGASDTGGSLYELASLTLTPFEFLGFIEVGHVPTTGLQQ
jgi:hypothetical protein